MARARQLEVPDWWFAVIFSSRVADRTPFSSLSRHFTDRSLSAQGDARFSMSRWRAAEASTMLGSLVFRADCPPEFGS
jgi:hypothetical protein